VIVSHTRIEATNSKKCSRGIRQAAPMIALTKFNHCASTTASAVVDGVLPPCVSHPFHRGRRSRDEALLGRCGEDRESAARKGNVVHSDCEPSLENGGEPRRTRSSMAIPQSQSQRKTQKVISKQRQKEHPTQKHRSMEEDKERLRSNLNHQSRGRREP
jgi:hypothetical protein